VGITAAVFLALVGSFRSVRLLPRDEERDRLYLLLVGIFVAYVTLTGHGILIPNAWWYIHWYVFVIAYALRDAIRARLIDEDRDRSGLMAA
jgi:hypothetical protein